MRYFTDGKGRARVHANLRLSDPEFKKAKGEVQWTDGSWHEIDGLASEISLKGEWQPEPAQKEAT